MQIDTAEVTPEILNGSPNARAALRELGEPLLPVLEKPQRSIRNEEEAAIHLSELFSQGARRQRKPEEEVGSGSDLFRKKCAAANPEFCEGFEILLVTIGNCVFLPTFDTQTVLAC